jgi:predicted nucleic acid-binding protein
VARRKWWPSARTSRGHWLEARRLCSGIDEKDTPFIALTIHLNAHLWTEDDELKKALRARGFDLFFEP